MRWKKLSVANVVVSLVPGQSGLPSSVRTWNDRERPSLV